MGEVMAPVMVNSTRAGSDMGAAMDAASRKLTGLFTPGIATASVKLPEKATEPPLEDAAATESVTVPVPTNGLGRATSQVFVTPNWRPLLPRATCRLEALRPVMEVTACSSGLPETLGVAERANLWLLPVYEARMVWNVMASKSW